MPRSEHEKLLQAAVDLGIKDPHLLRIAELRRAVRLYQETEDLRQHAQSIGIELPDEGTKGTLERIFRQGEEWEVESIRPVRGDPRSTRRFILRPVAGGKAIGMPDTTLVGYLYRICLSASIGSLRAALSAGVMPKRTPTTSATVILSPNICASMTGMTWKKLPISAPAP